MYIKIKHIKHFLLISACLFFAGFNYLNHVKADDTSIGDQKSCDKAIDADCDGLTTAEEKLYGTDSNDSDTDGDGYSDGVEVKSGYDPLKPSPGDKIVASTAQDLQKNISSLNPSLTNNFAADLQSFIASKNGAPITSSDINAFVESNLAAKMGGPVTVDSLPAVDSSQMKILDQTYASLSVEARKKQIETDSQNYFTQLIYLVIANLPTVVTNRDDLSAFGQDFLERYASLSDPSPDYEYFSDLGRRLDSLLIQVDDIEVPQTMVDLHIRMIRITKGFLTLREIQVSTNDPISKMALISKIKTLSEITADFLKTDIANYLVQFQK